MSRTLKDRKTGKPKKKRKNPYGSEDKKGEPKFFATPGKGLGVSKLGKLIAKNANRSRKKSARQEGKKIIKTELLTKK
ncbi:MAG: hypothetical protein HC836_34720 [Richelia sp. RM2_1_2]|nr:hypothetical protein [Richelia sp. RM2_1_2]